MKEPWCIPPQRDAEFVAAMEDVLEVYHRPYDAKRPLVCLDEASKPLVGEIVAPIPATVGQPERFDYEYVRNGTANLFLVSEPLLGWRVVLVTQRRTAKDFAEVVRWLVEEVHPDAEKVVLVMDNLNTHKVASLYEAFPPEQARRIAERLEIHHTPKHGSWLNVAEIESSVRTRQCLDRRIDSADELRAGVNAWEAERNERAIEVRWRFTTADARIKLHRLYPSIQYWRSTTDSQVANVVPTRAHPLKFRGETVARTRCTTCDSVAAHGPTLIPVVEPEAHRFGCNAVVVGKTVFTTAAAPGWWRTWGDSGTRRSRWNWTSS